MYSTHMRVVYHFCCCQSHSSEKERSIRKYGKSPNEVSFFERSITGHPDIGHLRVIVGHCRSRLPYGHCRSGRVTSGKLN